MSKFFFAGHSSFGNRGCEALVRSVSGLIQEKLPQSVFFTPSSSIDLDGRQWPTAGDQGVRFVEAAPFPVKLRWWNRARRVLPFIEYVGRPTHRLPQQVRENISAADVVIMTGGDTISLDYDLPSLYDHAGYIDNAKRLGKKTFLWGASVGPFSKWPHVEALMKKHLRDYDAITVRESETAAYLRGLGIDKVVQVTDPAFTMAPEPFALDDILPAAPEGVVGINVSPLVRSYRSGSSSQEALDADVVRFAQDLAARGYGVVFTPHVGQLDGGAWNSDFHYMKSLMVRYGLVHPSIRLAPDNLNAAQLKYLISRFRFFIGARTHATIAAFSMGVPTISIAYSIKAKGINKDLFGDTRLVLDTPSVTLQTLQESLVTLLREEDGIKQHLAVQIPVWRQRAASSTDVLIGLL